MTRAVRSLIERAARHDDPFLVLAGEALAAIGVADRSKVEAAARLARNAVLKENGQPHGDVELLDRFGVQGFDDVVRLIGSEYDVPQQDLDMFSALAAGTAAVRAGDSLDEVVGVVVADAEVIGVELAPDPPNEPNAVDHKPADDGSTLAGVPLLKDDEAGAWAHLAAPPQATEAPRSTAYGDSYNPAFDTIDHREVATASLGGGRRDGLISDARLPGQRERDETLHRLGE